MSSNTNGNGLTNAALTLRDLAARHRYLVGPLLTLAVLILIEAISRSFFAIPNPAVIYFTAVVFAAFHGGIGPGLVSAAITLIYAAWFFSKTDLIFFRALKR